MKNTINVNTMNVKMEKEMNRITKMVNHKVLTAVLLLAAVLVGTGSNAQAAFSEKAAGTKGGQFLKLPVGARAIGMGEAYTAVADDADSIYYNVAGLARLEKKNAEYMYAGTFLKNKATGDSDPGYHWVAFGMPISPTIGSAGIALQYYSAGDINETNLNAAKVGTFSPSDLAVNLAYARMVADIPLGINLKIINSKIKESATTVAVDLGAQYTKLMQDRLMLGFAVQNLGGSLKYETENTKLPIMIKLGSGYKIQDNWVAALDLAFPEDNDPALGIGTDYKYKIQEDMSLSGRIGYNSRTRKVDGFNGLTIGFGFGFKMASLDYVYQPLGDLGSNHRFSLGVKF